MNILLTVLELDHMVSVIVNSISYYNSINIITLLIVISCVYLKHYLNIIILFFFTLFISSFAIPNHSRNTLHFQYTNDSNTGMHTCCCARPVLILTLYIAGPNFRSFLWARSHNFCFCFVCCQHFAALALSPSVAVLLHCNCCSRKVGVADQAASGTLEHD